MTAATGRDDYDKLVHFRALAPDEPYFMIRGQDAVSGDAVRAWAQLARDAGAPPALVEAALEQADRLDAWPTKKVPDDDHIDPAERAQLAYRLERRAWAARADCADTKVMLAEERAHTAVRASLRPILHELFERGAWTPDGAFVFTPDPDAATNAVAALHNLDVVPRRGRPIPPARVLVEAAKQEAATAARLADAGERDQANRALGRAEGLTRAARLLGEPGKDL